MAVPSAGGSRGQGAPDAAGSPAGPAGLPRGYGWDGGSGTTWRTDPAAGLTGILLTQRQMTSPEPTEIAKDFWTAAYAAAGS
jgi:CubicO group peptidase (beta-lactamase class C family)